MSPTVASMTDTGRVRIGIAYIPRQTQPPSADAALIQQALLDKRCDQPVPFINRVLAPFWRWL